MATTMVEMVENIVSPAPKRSRTGKSPEELRESKEARAANARAGFDRKFIEMVDPEGKLSSEEREKAIAEAKQKYFKDISAKGRESRKLKGDVKQHKIAVLQRKESAYIAIIKKTKAEIEEFSRTGDRETAAMVAKGLGDALQKIGEMGEEGTNGSSGT